jgi:probable HAF family extracellular repeat protein
MPAIRRSIVLLAASCTTTTALSQTTYRIIDLTERANPSGVVQCEGRMINENNQVVGFEVLPDLFTARPIRWDADGSVHFLPLLPDDEGAYAFAITDAGVALGNSEDVRVEQVGHQTRIYITPKAAAWTGTEITDLNTLVAGGADLTLEVATAFNAASQIVGTASPPDSSAANGFLLDEGFVTDLGLLTNPTGINAGGTIVGYGFNAGGTHAIQWQNGVVTDLHANPPLTGVTSRAWGINDAGLIVGEAQFHISQPEQATLWVNGVPTKLVPEFTRPQGIASAINNRAQVVGFYIDLDNLNDVWHGFLWRDGQRADLVDLLDDPSGWQQMFAFDINEKGQIVGGGFRNGEIGHGFLMTPIIPGDLDWDADVDLQDLATMLAQFGTPGCLLCPHQGCADTDCDGDIDLSDLAQLLANFGRVGG